MKNTYRKSFSNNDILHNRLIIFSVLEKSDSFLCCIYPEEDQCQEEKTKTIGDGRQSNVRIHTARKAAARYVHFAHDH